MLVSTTRFTLTMFWMILLCGCATRMSPASTEQLRAQPPAGWVKVYQYNHAGSRISEFIPANEERLKWTNKVTFESFAPAAYTDPIDLLLFEVDQYQKNCNFVQHFNLFAGLENNYPTSLRLVMCGKSEVLKTGSVTMLKAISGDRNFYIIRLTRKVPAFEPHQSDVSKNDIAQWSVYLSRISVCDESSAEHPCTGQDTE